MGRTVLVDYTGPADRTSEPPWYVLGVVYFTMTSPLPNVNDPSPITAEEIDWEGWFDPEWIDHVRDNMLAGALANGTCTRRLVAGCMVTYGNREQVSINRRSKVLADLSHVTRAHDVYVAQAGFAEEAKRAFRSELRGAYAAGATAASLAEATGLSLARVQQLVAGAR